MQSVFLWRPHSKKILISNSFALVQEKRVIFSLEGHSTRSCIHLNISYDQ